MTWSGSVLLQGSLVSSCLHSSRLQYIAHNLRRPRAALTCAHRPKQGRRAAHVANAGMANDTAHTLPHSTIVICRLRQNLRCRLFISTVPPEPLARIKNSLGELYPAAQGGAFHEGHQAVPAGAHWPFFSLLVCICVVLPGAEIVCHATA